MILRHSSDQFRQSSGILERNFFHYMPFVFLYFTWVVAPLSKALILIQRELL